MFFKKCENSPPPNTDDYQDQSRGIETAFNAVGVARKEAFAEKQLGGGGGGGFQGLYSSKLNSLGLLFLPFFCLCLTQTKPPTPHHNSYLIYSFDQPRRKEHDEMMERRRQALAVRVELENGGGWWGLW